MILINVTMIIFCVLFLAMFIYLGIFVSTSTITLYNNSYNNRQELQGRNVLRGTIYSSDGEVLAETRVDENGNEIRYYPYGSMFAHAVGYSVNGRMGIEDYANYYLMHSGASLTDRVNNDLENIKNPGYDVYSTLNVDLQKVADDYLGMYNGAVIVTEAKTGRVLVLISHPDFNPGTIREDWETITSNPDNSQLLNRATQGLYPPGSTFKIITALEYYRENPDTWDEYAYTCTGNITHGDYRVSCIYGTVHGDLDLEGSFARSCNSSFVNIGLSLSRNSWEDTLEELYFNRPIPTDMLVNSSSLYIGAGSTDYDIMQTAIGQGKTLMTPLHLNMITQAIANHGVMMRPYIIESIVDDDGNVIRDYEPQSIGQVMTEDEAEYLTELMMAVVEYGTGRALITDYYTCAGKTGTAEFANDINESHAWFTAFAPAEDPEICVTIIIEKAGTGMEYAVPLAKRIFDAYFGVEN
ncbi:MAG: penicillin-binding protein 2 [Lachnospiraceae bacterium]|nr:penicillin-binding protein 2 [Lachnospiraceae bacterium]